MLVIGVDPGAINTGLAWVMGKDPQYATHAQVETISCTQAFPSRYAIFREKLDRFLTAVPEDPVAIAMEEPIGEVPRKTTEDEFQSLLHLSGIYAIVVSEATRLWPKAQLFAWKPRLWRRYGDDKEKVERRMAKKYNLRFTSDDESDALGVADHAWLLMSQRRGRAAETWIARTSQSSQSAQSAKKEEEKDGGK